MGIGKGAVGTSTCWKAGSEECNRQALEVFSNAGRVHSQESRPKGI